MRNLLKIGLAGTVIFAIAMGMVVLQPGGDDYVSNADADIAAFSFAPKSQQQRFVDTLKREGMEEPRAYDHNGNKLFFSTTTTDESPRQVMKRFQRAFVENGVNDAVHLSPIGPIESAKILRAVRSQDRRELKRQKEQNDVRASQINDYVGGVVPMMVDADRVIMTGTSSRGEADTYEEWLGEIADQYEENGRTRKGFDPSQTTKAMRHVEAFREGSKTRINAIWSDEDYEPSKIADIGEDLNVDPALPSCPGCERLYNIEGDTERDYTAAAYDANRSSVDQVLRFYDGVLRKDGWRPSPTAKLLEHLEERGIKERTDGKMVQYSRGAKFLTVVAWPGKDSTTVHVSRSN